MVWGWYERSHFGDFFPNGDYVGWEEGLKQYFDEQMSAEQRAALNDWHVAYIGEVARKFREDRGCSSRTNARWNSGWRSHANRSDRCCI